VEGFITEMQALKEQQRVTRIAPPRTRPATRPRRTVVAHVEHPTTRSGEVAGRDPYHPHDPKDPFLIALATRHIDGPTDTARAVALSRDKTKLVVGGNDRTVRLFDFATGKQLRSFEGHTAFILGVDISPNGSQVISCGEDHTIRVWDVATGDQVGLLEEHQDDVIAVHFLSDNEAVSASHDGTARIWDIDKETTVKKIDYRRRVCAWACAARKLLAVGTHSGDVYLWDLQTRTQIRQFSSVSTCIKALLISDDGKKLVVVPNSKPFVVFDVPTGKKLFQEPLPEEEEEFEGAHSAALSGDGQILALSQGLRVIFYNLQDFKLCKTFLNSNAYPQAISFVPDGPGFVIVGGGRPAEMAWIRPWDDIILIYPSQTPS
jgi:WD40 repeat protein